MSHARIALMSLILLSCHGVSAAPEARGGTASREHGDEVIHLGAEASRIADVRVGSAARRAVSGGAAIPAEVQFDPSGTAHVAPLVAGRFTRIAATLGATVQRGELLAVLASSDVSAARARLLQARARLSAAQSALTRQRTLASEGISAQRALIEAEAQVADLRAEVAGLQQQLTVFGSGAAGEVRLTSPIDGVVAVMHATLGENIRTDTAAFEIIDARRVWVRGAVPELDLARVAVGQAAVVRLHAYPEASYRGRVTYVAPALDEASRALPIRVTLDAVDARLRGGLYGSIELLDDDAQRPVTVPVDAVATLDGRAVVFVPAQREGDFRAREVLLGRRGGGYVEVAAGLGDGEAVVERGAFTLKSVARRDELEGEE